MLWGLAKSVRGAAGVSGGLAANGYGEHSPGGFSLVAVLLVEILLTAFFVFVILGVTTAHAPTGFAPLAIGLTLTLIHLISIPIDNTSVNPARSLGVAFFQRQRRPGPGVGVHRRADRGGGHRGGPSRPSPASTAATSTSAARSTPARS